MRRKTEEKRQAIVDAAFEVFSESGFEQASMSDIAARVGGSKATLYSYFESKEEMFFEVMIESAASEVKAAFDLLKISVPVRDTLTSFGKHYLIAILQPQLLAIRRLANHEGGRSHIGVLFHERGPKIGWQMVADYLDQASEAGQLRRCNSAAATAHLRALYEAELLELALLGVPVDTSPRNIAKVIQRAVDVFTTAYGPEKPALA
ncbi:MAG TPA: TetR/AcrR family transcriptional regulator [Paraburkholderia sp.]|uniref:TetR/AcrR family transcriptional regulator n=1 Tax=Paraburkholderia sp. TaxID=1926495 RepID=UPI002B481238|nr:TetR/AcrR family transcriptional regulator [Paraburkholderia sp.]HKR41061.1 TetR/AcrR family transcriptional regulator [Paraburkholderia sp.]